jgi:glycyl-tRNA synthetase alpha subunit
MSFQTNTATASIFSNAKRFIDIIRRHYDYPVIPHYPYPVSSATLTPECFFGCFRPQYSFIRLQPVFRPTDSRYIVHTTHLPLFLQIQIFSDHLDTQFDDELDLLADFLTFTEHEVTISNEEEWFAESINCKGVGREVFINNVEVAQTNIISRMGGVDLHQPKRLICFGVDRLCLAALRSPDDNPLANITNCLDMNTVNSIFQLNTLLCPIMQNGAESYLKLRNRIFHILEETTYRSDRFDTLSDLTISIEVLYSQCVISSTLRRRFILLMRQAYERTTKFYHDEHLNFCVTTQGEINEANSEVELIYCHALTKALEWAGRGEQRIKLEHWVDSREILANIDSLIEALKPIYSNIDNDTASELQGMMEFDFSRGGDELLLSALNTETLSCSISYLTDMIKRFHNFLQATYAIEFANESDSCAFDSILKNVDVFFSYHGMTTARSHPYLDKELVTLFIRTFRGNDCLLTNSAEIVFYNRRNREDQLRNYDYPTMAACLVVLLFESVSYMSEVHGALSTHDPYRLKRKLRRVDEIMYSRPELNALYSAFCKFSISENADVSQAVGILTGLLKSQVNGHKLMT